MSTQTRHIKITADVKGNQDLRAMAKEFAKVNGSVRETTGVLKTFRNAFFALQGFSFAGFGIRELTQSMDSYQKLSDRIKVFTGNQVEANNVMDGLARVADNTRASIEGVATVYSRLALSLNESKLSSGDLLFLTEQLQNSFRLSGATAAEATGATIQLSQGLASGTLRGQELRSVLESNALIGAMLSKELKTTRGQLMKLAEAGKITGDVFLKAVANGSIQLHEDAKTLGVTFQEATDRGLNKFNVALGKFNKEMGLSTKYDSFIQGLAGNLTAVGIAMGALAVMSIPTLIAGLAKLKIAFMTFSASNPILLTFTAIASAVAFAYYETEKFEAGVLKFRQSFVMAYADMRMGAWELVRAIGYVTSAGKGNFLTEMADGAISDAAKMKEGALREIKAIDKATEDIAKGNAAIDMLGVETFETQLAKFRKGLERMKKEAPTAIQSIENQIKALNTSFANGGVSVRTYNDKIMALTTELYKKKGPIPMAKAIEKMEKENLARLFEHGIIKAEDFQAKMDALELSHLDAQLNSSRITMVEYHKGVDAIYQKQFELNAVLRDQSMRQYSESLRNGSMSMTQYGSSMETLKLKEINDDLKSGKTNIYEYNKALAETSEKFQPGAALFTGTHDYIKSAGTLSQNVASMVTQTFGNLEDALVEFTKTGKFNFRDFAKSVMDDLNRIIMRALIIRPLAQGILGAIPASGGDSTGAVSNAGMTDGRSSMANYAAKGAVFDGMKSNFFANGGVVSGRTPFAFGGGRKGIMGEAGPEAIMPLRRGSDGSLGVVANGGGSNVTVNVINQSGSNEVEQRESTDSMGNRTLDIVITTKVKEAFTNGSMDKIMSTQYGAKRRGF